MLGGELQGVDRGFHTPADRRRVICRAHRVEVKRWRVDTEVVQEVRRFLSLLIFNKDEIVVGRASVCRVKALFILLSLTDRGLWTSTFLRPYFSLLNRHREAHSVR